MKQTKKARLRLGVMMSVCALGLAGQSMAAVADDAAQDEALLQGTASDRENVRVQEDEWQELLRARNVALRAPEGGSYVAVETFNHKMNDIYQLVNQIEKTDIHYVSVKGPKGDTATANYNNGGATGDNAVAIGVETKSVSRNGIAVGYKANSKGTDASAIGTEAEAAGNDSIAFGTMAESKERQSVALGRKAQASVAYGVALGGESVADVAEGKFGYAFADDKKARYDKLAAITQTPRANLASAYQAAKGTDKEAAAKQALDEWDAADKELGQIKSTWRSGMGAVSVGTQTSGRQIIHLAAGTEDTDAVNVGQLKVVKNQLEKQMPEGGVHYVSVTGTETGENSNFDNKGATANGAIAIGEGAKTSGFRSTGIGADAAVSGARSVAIGANAETTGDMAVAGGHNARAMGRGSMALGWSSKAVNADGIAIGQGARVSLGDAISQAKYDTLSDNVKQWFIAYDNPDGTKVYYQVKAPKQDGSLIDVNLNSIALGNRSAAEDSDVVAIGSRAKGAFVGATAIGAFAKAEGKQSTTAGYVSSAKGDQSTAVGGYTQANGDHAAAFGYGAKVDDNKAGVAMGYESYSKRKGGIGWDPETNAAWDESAVSADLKAQVAAIDKEIAEKTEIEKKAKEELDKFPQDTELKEKWRLAHNEVAAANEKKHKLFVPWKTEFGDAAIGNEETGMTRQLTGLAAGSADTDAVNVAQLKALDKKKANLDASNLTNEKDIKTWKQALGIDALSAGNSLHYFSVNHTDTHKESNYKNDGSKAFGGIAIGANTSAHGIYGSAIGVEALSIGGYSQAWGYYALAASEDGISKDAYDALSEEEKKNYVYREMKVGPDDKSAYYRVNYPEYTNEEFKALGKEKIKHLMGDLGYGYSSTRKKWIATPRAIAIGHMSKAVSAGSMAMGNWAESLGVQSTAIGAQAKTEGGYSFAAGDRAHTKGDSAVAVGYKANATGAWSTAIGATAKASDTSDTAIGGSSEATGGRSVAIGSEAKAQAYGAQAMGYKAVASGQFSISEGTQATASGKWSIAQGLNSKAEKDKSLAIGAFAAAKAEESVALGANSLAAVESGKVGYAFAADGATLEQTIEAAGQKEKYDQLKAVVNPLKDEYNGLVQAYQNAPNKSSEETKAKQELDTWIQNHGDFMKAVAEKTKLESTWQSGAGAVSVGNAAKGMTRQITNLAAGTQDTDAVNVAQLKVVNEKADANATAMKSKADKDAENIEVEKWKTKLGINELGKGSMSSWKLKATGDTNSEAIADGNEVEFAVAEANKGLTVARAGKTIKYGIDANKLVENINTATTKITNVDGSKIDLSNNTAITNLTTQVKGNKIHYLSIGPDNEANLAKGGNYNNDGADSHWGIAIGVDASSKEAGIAMGKNSRAWGNGSWTGQSVAIGSGSAGMGDYAVALGHMADAYGDSATAVGAVARAYGAGGVAMGEFALTANAKGISKNEFDALSEEEKALYAQSALPRQKTFYKVKTRTDSGEMQDIKNYGVAIGSGATAIGNSGIALGSSAKSNADWGMALGVNASVTESQGVALGVNSVSDRAANVKGYLPTTNAQLDNFEAAMEVLGKKDEFNALKQKYVAANSEAERTKQAYLANTGDASLKLAYEQAKEKLKAATNEYVVMTGAWESRRGAVSIGNEKTGFNRQLTGLAAGTQDTDAVNVAQLKVLDAKKADKNLNNITEEGQTVIKKLAKGAVVVAAGTNTTVQATEDAETGVKTYTVNVAADGQVTDGNAGIVTGGTVYNAIKDKADKSELTDIKSNITNIDNSINSLKGGFTIQDANATVGKTDITLGDATKSAITFKAVLENKDGAASALTATVGADKSVTYTLNTKKLKEDLGITQGVGTMSSFKLKTGTTEENVADGDTVEFYTEKDKGLTISQANKKVTFGVDGSKIDLTGNTSITNINTNIENITKQGGTLDTKLAAYAKKDASNLGTEDVTKWKEKLGINELGKGTMSSWKLKATGDTDSEAIADGNEVEFGVSAETDETGLKVNRNGKTITYGIDKDKLVKNISGDIITEINNTTNNTTPITNISTKFSVQGAETPIDLTMTKDQTPNVKFEGEADKIDVTVAKDGTGAKVTVKANAKLGEKIDISNNSSITNIKNDITNITKDDGLLSKKANVDAKNVEGDNLKAWQEKLGIRKAGDNNYTDVNTSITNINKDITALKGGFTIKDTGTGTSDITLGGTAKNTITFKAKSENTDGAASALTATVGADKSVTYTLNTKKLKTDLGIDKLGTGSMSSWKLKASSDAAGTEAAKIENDSEVIFGASTEKTQKGLVVTREGRTITYGINRSELAQSIAGDIITEINKESSTKITNVDWDKWPGMHFFKGGTMSEGKYVPSPEAGNTWQNSRIVFGEGLRAEEITGVDGKTKYTKITVDRTVIKDGNDGANGKSAFDIWKEENGKPTATKEEFLNALKGQDGTNGTNGENGKDGKSAYQVWKEYQKADGTKPNENKTEDDFMEYMKGKDGTGGAGGTDFTVKTDETATAAKPDTKVDAAHKEFTIAGDKKNITTSIGGNNTVKVALKDDINVKSVTVGDVKIDGNGINAGNKKVTNVAAGELSKDSKDAVNGSQLFATNENVAANTKNIENNAKQITNLNQNVTKLGGAIGELRDESREGDALNAALAALKPLDFDPLQRSQIMAGVSTYKGKQAVALGLAHYSNEDTLIHGGISYAGSSDLMANLGISWRFGDKDDRDNRKARAERMPQYAAGPISSVYVLQDEVATLKDENAALRAENEEIKEQVALLLERMQRANL